jgi:hypothetical protein
MPAQTPLPSTIRYPNITQNPRIIQVGAWVPDQPALSGAGSSTALNCRPLTQGSYGPMPSLISQGAAALPGPVFGMFATTDTTGEQHIFAGTATDLYHLSTSTGPNFVTVTQTGESYNAYYLNPWVFTAYAGNVIAVNGVDPPQIFTLLGSTEFGDLATNAPVGHYCATVRDFVLMGNCLEGSTQYPQRVHWSCVGNPSFWPPLGSVTAQELLSDAQDLRSDLGQVRGIASGLQSGDFAVFMDEGVYQGLWVGSPATFSFQLVPGATGCRIPNSIISHMGRAFYLGNNGFWSYDGSTPNPIGAEKIDDWFFHDDDDAVDPGYISLTQGAADPSGKYVYWIYCGPNSNGHPTRLLIYNWILGEWSVARINCQWIAKALSVGYTLDELDAFGTLDSLQSSLDSPIWVGGSPILLAFDMNNMLSHFAGPSLAALIDTSEEELEPGRRCRVTSARPLIDGDADDGEGITAVPTIAIGGRSRQSDPVVFGPAMPLNNRGECIQRNDNRYVRGQIAIPAGTQWTHCEGIVVDYAASTRR